MGLEMNGAGAGWAREERDMPRMRRSAYVDDADAVGVAVADIGIAAMHHDLDAIAAPTLVRVADEFDAARHRCSHRSPRPMSCLPLPYQRVGGAMVSRAKPLVSELICVTAMVA